MKRITILSIFLILAVLLSANALAAVTLDGLENYEATHASTLTVRFNLRGDDAGATFNDVQTEVTGDQDWITTATKSPATISTLNQGDIVSVTLTFAIPPGTIPDFYQVKVDFKVGSNSILPNAQTFNIEVTPDKSLTIDQTKVKITGQSGESSLVSQDITITNTGNKPVTLTPEVVFGDDVAGTIDIDGDVQFTIVDPNNNNLEIAHITLVAGASQTIRVQADASDSNADYAIENGKLNFNDDVNDDASETTLASTDLQIKLGDKGVCKLGPQNTGKIILDSDSDLDDYIDDDFKIGEKVDFKFKVKNKLGEDADIEVEAVLYNKETDKVIDSDSDSQKIDHNEEEVFEFELYLDPDEIEGEDNIVLLLKAYPDETDYQEDEYCNEEEYSINVEQDDSDLRVEDIQVLPTSLEPGNSFEIIATLVNYGKDEVSNARLKVKNSELEIEVESERYELEDYDNDNNDNEQRIRVMIEVPADAEAKDYEFEVYAESGSGEQDFETVTVTVEGEAKQKVLEVEPDNTPEITGSVIGEMPSSGSTNLAEKSVFDRFKKTSDLPLLFWVILDIVLVAVIVTVILLVVKKK